MDQSRTPRAPLPLSARTLPALAPHLPVPSYSRAALRPGVVHLGVGAFARSHQGMYFDDIAALSGDWGVRGVALRSRHVVEALDAQDGLYTVLERDGDGDRPRIVGSMLGTHHAPSGPGEVLGVLADARTRLVTLTVTGDGYPVDADGGFDPTEIEVSSDIGDQTAGLPHAPRTAFGYLAEALAARRAADLPPFTVLSCDNIADNGTTARTALLGMAAARGDGLAEWVAERGAFPNSMVDRITPATTEEHRDAVARLRSAGAGGVVETWHELREVLAPAGAGCTAP